ncbi:hypothetical protein PZ61_0235700 [Streptomyces sp. MNU77]|uniref:GntR family transcriptional regulator n=1 Tax=Streptomyces sp. MNU77 TaxID=1573406 RepID=UPI0005E7BE2B|nr:GntR family transcriptional regulator [Streptomyces sp. MNU77]OLO25783.1 hypothetical protein PZ61_0235700 [Streptomyces sp. MNU77]
MPSENAAVRPVQRVPLVEAVTEQLREMIINGTLEPGRQLLQIELSEHLGVSRTPLREAFRVLERDGLVRVSNGNKTVEVVAMTASEITDLYEVREVIDGLAARLLAGDGVTPEAETQLGAAMAAMEKMLSAKRLDLAKYSEAHFDFHMGIVRAAGNRRLLDLGHIVRISARMSLSRFLQHSGEGATGAKKRDTDARIRALLVEGTDDHRLIFEAIKAGDGRKAETLARRHIRKATAEVARAADEAAGQ